MQARLIGIDWGTTNLRAYLFGDDGVVIETRRRPHGLRALPEGGFDAAFAGIVAGWPRCPRIACGMVGARGGWQEVPYLELPVDARRIGAALARVRAQDGDDVHLVPGLCDPQRPDVMRGEETQILGGLSAHEADVGSMTMLLPGTHSKWVRMRDGRIVEFRTMMTGELFAVLCAHSLLGAGVPDDAPHDDGWFLCGVRAAADSGEVGVMPLLFTVRARMLTADLPPEGVPSFLSGLLIGEEVRTMLASTDFPLSLPVHLNGSDRLCALYRRALAEYGIPAADLDGDAAAMGLWRIARRAGLLRANTTNETETTAP